MIFVVHAERLYRILPGACRVEDLHALKEDGIGTSACDVRDPGSISACVAHVIAAAGAVSVLINNAGKAPSDPDWMASICGVPSFA